MKSSKGIVSKKLFIIEHKTPDYSEWLSKNNWDFQQAIPLLFGIDPSWIQSHIEENKFETPYLSNKIEFDLNLKVDDNFHKLNQIFFEYKYYAEVYRVKPSNPYDWLNWFCSLGATPNKDLLECANKSGWSLDIKKESLIYEYYSYWAKKDAWSFLDAVALLCVTKPSEAGELSIRLPDCAYFGTQEIYNNVSQQLIYSISSKTINYIEVDCHSHIERRFLQKDIIEWAGVKGYRYPKLLLQILGYESPEEPSSQNRKKKGCKDEIIEEFKHRAQTKSLSKTWEDEINYLQQFALTHDESYEKEALKNIIKKAAFLKAKKQPN